MQTAKASASPQPSLFHQAAQFSWVSVLCFAGIIGFTGQVLAPVVRELFGMLFLLVGFVCGIVALFGIRKHGVKGILAPALVGLVMQSLIISIFVTNFMAARERQVRRSAHALSIPDARR